MFSLLQNAPYRCNTNAAHEKYYWKLIRGMRKREMTNSLGRSHRISRLEGKHRLFETTFSAPHGEVQICFTRRRRDRQRTHSRSSIRNHQISEHHSHILPSLKSEISWFLKGKEFRTISYRVMFFESERVVSHRSNFWNKKTEVTL